MNNSEIIKSEYIEYELKNFHLKRYIRFLQDNIENQIIYDIENTFEQRHFATTKFFIYFYNGKSVLIKDDYSIKTAIRVVDDGCFGIIKNIVLNFPSDFELSSQKDIFSIQLQVIFRQIFEALDKHYDINKYLVTNIDLEM
jgi:hypothetical protein